MHEGPKRRAAARRLQLDDDHDRGRRSVKLESMVWLCCSILSARCRNTECQLALYSTLVLWKGLSKAAEQLTGWKSNETNANERKKREAE